MRSSRDPRAVVLEHVDQLEHLWPKVRDGDVDGIHQARVASRRIRAALPLVPRVSPTISKTFRRIGRQLGRVRELDATSEVLNELYSRVPSAPAVAIGELRHQLERKRQARRRRLIKAVDDISIFKLGRGVAIASHGFGTFRQWWHPWTAALRAELRRLAGDVESKMDRASGIYMPKRTHQVRIAVKKLRYALEVGTATGVVLDPEPLSELKSAQEVLGRLHDLCVLQKVVRGAALEGDASANDRAVLECMIAVESSHLYAKYLRRRARVVEACRACAHVGRDSHSAIRLATGAAAAVSFALWNLRAGDRAEVPEEQVSMTPMPRLRSTPAFPMKSSEGIHSGR